MKIPEEKVFVVYLAAEDFYKPLKIDDWSKEIREKYHLPQRFVLNLGDVNYNKNLLNLAKACKKVVIPLVVVGKQAVQEDVPSHTENIPFKNFLKIYGRDKDIVRVGYVLDCDLVKIFNLASLYCQPSFYEGFGLGILKAFACGTCVVASKIQAHVEIAEDAALFADPFSVQDLTKKIKMVLDNDSLRQVLVKKGLAEVKRFSWDKTALDTMQVYKKVAANE